MISERTGYPADMLALDLNLEADLGIDSIKRVEILGAFRKQHIGELTEPVRLVTEQLTRKKTLREIVDGLTGLVAERSNGPAPHAPVAVHENSAAKRTALRHACVARAPTARTTDRIGSPGAILALYRTMDADH